LARIYLLSKFYLEKVFRKENRKQRKKERFVAQLTSVPRPSRPRGLVSPRACLLLSLATGSQLSLPLTPWSHCPAPPSSPSRVRAGHPHVIRAILPVLDGICCPRARVERLYKTRVRYLGFVLHLLQARALIESAAPPLDLTVPRRRGAPCSSLCRQIQVRAGLRLEVKWMPRPSLYSLTCFTARSSTPKRAGGFFLATLAVEPS